MDLSTSAILRQLGTFRHGYLQLRLPDGSTSLFGAPSEEPARIEVHRTRFFRRLILSGDIGLGDAYVDGDWESPNPAAVVAYLLRNLRPVDAAAVRGTSAALKIFHRARHFLRRNTPRSSRRNISAHYDLSNALFALFLDPGLTYSSAWFTHPDQTLEGAQEEKYARICAPLELTPDSHLLEIGCGWGGLALHAARNYGCRVTAITLSREQLALATERVHAAHLGDRIGLRYCDYRDLQGQFDAVASIEMVEAVGHAFLPDYFNAIARVLAPHGTVSLQAILSPDPRHERGRKSVDWIQARIFPGGHLPSIGSLTEAASTSNLWLQRYEAFGLHYAETLRRWRTAFEERLDEVHALGFDERFVRAWRFYLCFCEAAFAQRNITVAHLSYTRPNNTSRPLTSEAGLSTATPVGIGSATPPTPGRCDSQKALHKPYKRAASG